MLRLLILLGLVAAAVMVVMKLRRGSGGPAAAPPPKNKETAQPAQMVACAHCGVHLPRPDALFDPSGRPYCGEPHRVAGPR
jgi:uncharacterized protein